MRPDSKDNEGTPAVKIPPILGPFLFIALYFGIFALLKGSIPTPDEILSELKNLYSSFGYYLVFLAALLEGLFIVGLYIPGSTVILFGAALSRGGTIEFSLVVLLGTLGLLSAYITNYFLGKYGWYHALKGFGLEAGIDEASENIKKHGKKAIFLGYFFPGSAALISTACGVMKVPFHRFLLLSVVSQGFWSLLWGSVAYSFGMLFVELFFKYFGFVVMAGLVVWFLRKVLRKKS